jgi:hypothetical protein
VFEELPMLPYGGPLPAIDVDTGELPAMAPLSVSTLSPGGSPVTREVDAYINTSPDEVAQLMRSWSQERSTRGS